MFARVRPRALTLAAGLLCAAFTMLGARPALAAASTATPSAAVEAAARTLADQLAAATPGGTVAVTRITGKGPKESPLARLVEELLPAELATAATARFNVIETTRVREAAKGEIAKSLTDDADEASRVELGKFLSASVIVSGSVIVTGDTATASLRAVSVETTKVLASAKAVFGVPGTEAGKPLTLQVEVRAQQRLADGRLAEVPVRPGDALKTGDNLQLHFSLSRAAYVYVLLYSSGTGEAARVFPDAQIALDNFVKGNTKVVLPGDGLWFELDEHTGTETIYVLAADAPLDDIDRLLARMEKSADTAGSKTASASASASPQKPSATIAAAAAAPAPPAGGKSAFGDQLEAYVVKTRGFNKTLSTGAGKTETISTAQGEKVQRVTESVSSSGQVFWTMSFLHK